MAGLLIKELRLRGAVDRVLVVAPAPLTVQWQDEMWDKFDERFVRVSAEQVRWQLAGNPWQQENQVVTSLDFAKRDDILTDLLRAEWDLVIVDEAHKCAAATYGEGEVKKTRRYVLAEELARRTERLLLLTATPHSGDPDRFTNFLALLDPDQFSSRELVHRQLAADDSPYFLRRQKEDLVDEHGAKLFVPRHVLTQPFTLSGSELALYEAVTDYINQFLGAPPPAGVVTLSPWPGASSNAASPQVLAPSALRWLSAPSAFRTRPTRSNACPSGNGASTWLRWLDGPSTPLTTRPTSTTRTRTPRSALPPR
jgi:hypothetical protein